MQENVSFDNLLDFVQFMSLSENKPFDLNKTQTQQSDGTVTEPALWHCKFYYTKRTADILKAIAEKKAEKEAERLRVLEIEEADRRKRYEIVDHVRRQIEKKDAKE